MNRKDIERKQATLLNLKLESPEMMGSQIVAISLLEEMLVVLLKAGIVDTEQVENILTRTSDRLSRMCEGLKTPARQDARLLAEIERAKESGNIDIANIRIRVTTETSEHP